MIGRQSLFHLLDEIEVLSASEPEFVLLLPFFGFHLLDEIEVLSASEPEFVLLLPFFGFRLNVGHQAFQLEQGGLVLKYLVVKLQSLQEIAETRIERLPK